MKRTAKQIAQDAVNRMKKTTGQKLFGGVTILNERPQGMSYQEYRKHRAEQTKARKKLNKNYMDTPKITVTPELVSILERMQMELDKLRESRSCIQSKLNGIHFDAESDKSLASVEEVKSEPPGSSFVNIMRSHLNDLSRLNEQFRLACQHLSKITP